MIHHNCMAVQTTQDVVKLFIQGFYIVDEIINVCFINILVARVNINKGCIDVS